MTFSASERDLNIGVMDTNEQILNQTESVCPECLRRIPAQNVRRGDNVCMVKTCPEHGFFSTVIWRGEPSYESWGGSQFFNRPESRKTGRDSACPFDCDICSDHNLQPCAALLEVSSRCNLKCPVCFAATDNGNAFEDPPLSAIEGWYRTLLDLASPVNIQLSGGEPTLRDDLPEIIALGRRLGFDYIQVNTNGLRLGQDPGYVQKLKSAGLNCVFLQFDGLEDRVYEHLRGTSLLRLKKAAVKNCVELGLGVTLAVTLVPGINTGSIGDLIRFALKYSPFIRAVHFQPISYIGRYPKAPLDEDRVTIPEVIRALEEQTGGLVQVKNFIPPGLENPHCSFHGNFIVRPDGSLNPWISDWDSFRRGGITPREKLNHAKNFLAKQWSAPHSVPSEDLLSQVAEGLHPQTASDIFELLSQLCGHTLSISGMAFQDSWNLDLNRLRDCHIGIVNSNHRLIPFCACNITSRTGKTLYRTQDSSHHDTDTRC
ncbi:MAG: radical SAM protein [Deltaproteobacteria bacterium]|jgi:uncharacterized radical SAM superfamily Fe-S cluster-containing enzyme|nr:radical SAM protein [Deltaproteobacteria bacterium]